MKASLLSLALLLLAASSTARPHPGGAKSMPAPAPASCRSCNQTAPRAGDLAGAQGLRLGRQSAGGLRLGEPVEFDDGVGVNAGLCFPLYADGRLVTWLDAYHVAGARLFVRRCVEDASREGVDGGRGKAGWVEDKFEELTLGSGAAKFAELAPPSWGEFANPSFCGDHVAYWGVETGGGGRAEVRAFLFSLRDMRVTRQALVGHAEIASDSRSFFPAPAWSADSKGVTFDPPSARDRVGELKKVSLDTEPRP